MKLKRDQTVYFAQVKTPRGLPPTARVLVGAYAHPGRYLGTLRVRFDHTPYGLDCPLKWITQNPAKANALLSQRIAEEIREHTYQIGLLQEALAIHLKTATIAWSPKK